MILLPCRKCIVWACCTEKCYDYRKMIRLVSKVSFPFNMLIELYHAKDWLLLIATCSFGVSFIIALFAIVKMIMGVITHAKL